MRLVQLTTLTGEAWGATFSPDGNQVAFNWNGEKHDNMDIYVTMIGSSDLRRLTTNPAYDCCASWSPGRGR